MKQQKLEQYLNNFKGSEASYPFGPEALVFKVKGKMFALHNLSEDRKGISLTCDPELAIELREQHPEVTTAWLFNKFIIVFENTVKIKW